MSQKKRSSLARNSVHSTRKRWLQTSLVLFALNTSAAHTMIFQRLKQRVRDRIFQELQLSWHEERGLGLRAATKIPKGEFVIEYEGSLFSPCSFSRFLPFSSCSSSNCHVLKSYIIIINCVIIYYYNNCSR